MFVRAFKSFYERQLNSNVIEEQRTTSYLISLFMLFYRLVLGLDNEPARLGSPRSSSLSKRASARLANVTSRKASLA